MKHFWHMNTDLLNLVKETRRFIEENHVEDFFKKETISPKKVSLKQEKPLIQTPQEIPKAKEPVVKTSSSSLIDVKFEEMKKDFKHLFPTLFCSEMPTFVYLCAKEGQDMAFLEKVASAITDVFLPAKAVLCHDEKEFQKLLHYPSLKILLAPISFVSHYQNVKVHKLTKIQEKIHLLPLDNPKLYLNDPSYKRTLWNILKTLPFADLLQ